MITRVLLLTVWIATASTQEIINQWNFMDYDFPPGFDINNYRPENTPVVGLTVTADRFFIGTPRLRDGTGPTFSSISRKTPAGSSPKLQAYPNWSMHGAASGDFNCSGLISVYRARVDSCNRLWVLDAGTVSSLDNYSRPCDPKILVFDLRTDQLVRTIVFPAEVQRPASVFTNLELDESIQGQCDSTFVYISDSVAPGIVVYDALRGKTWRFSDPSMFPNPDFSSISIAEDQFSLMDGIIGLALSTQLQTLFYQALATDRIYSIPTATLTKGPPGEFEQLPISVAGRKASQGLPLTINRNDNTLFFSPITQTSVASWNAGTNQQSLLASDPVNLQFVADLRWNDDGYVYALSSRFHKYFLRTVSPGEVNSRIVRIPVSPVTTPEVTAVVPRRSYLPRFMQYYFK